MRSLTRLTGPNPKLRLIGPASPSNVTSWFSKSSDTDAHTLSRPPNHSRPSWNATDDGQPRSSDQSPISQSVVGTSDANGLRISTVTPAGDGTLERMRPSPRPAGPPR